MKINMLMTDFLRAQRPTIGRRFRRLGPHFVRLGAHVDGRFNEAFCGHAYRRNQNLLSLLRERIQSHGWGQHHAQ